MIPSCTNYICCNQLSHGKNERKYKTIKTHDIIWHNKLPILNEINSKQSNAIILKNSFTYIKVEF